MGSGRLPGKTLLNVAGQPLLGHLLDRLSLSRHLNAVVVATPSSAANDAIADYCADRGVPCHRGSEDDVLDRMLGALRMMKATVGVEIFGDCPLIDPVIVDDAIEKFVDAAGALDFIGNDLRTTYPPGMEVEVFAMTALEDAGNRASDPAVREHGTLFLRQHPELYRIGELLAPPEHAFPELELEVDTEDDVPVVRAVLEHFADRPRFTLSEIIEFLVRHPEIAERNTNVPRRWKLHRDAGN